MSKSPMPTKTQRPTTDAAAEATFGRGIKVARELTGLSLREVEAATGISNAYLSQLESDKIRRPSLFFLTKLATLYGINRDQLFNSLTDFKGIPVYTIPKPIVPWKWLPPPRNDEEQIEMAEYLKLIRSRHRRPTRNRPARHRTNFINEPMNPPRTYDELLAALPCPFCGSTRIVKGERYFAMCVDCGATGPERNSDATTRKFTGDWNTRHVLPNETRAVLAALDGKDAT